MAIITPFGFVSSPSDLMEKYNLSQGELARLVIAIKSDDNEVLSKYPKEAVEEIGMVFGGIAKACGLGW